MNGENMRLSIAFVLVLLTGFTLTAGRSSAATSSSARIAAAVNGNIILFRADGSGRSTITHRGIDSNPITSSGPGALVAFLRTRGGFRPYDRQPRQHEVMLAAPADRGGYAATRFSFRQPVSPPSRSDLAWDLGGHSPGLFWFDGHSVVYRRASGNEHPVLAVGPPEPFRSYQPIVVSPQGVAVPLTSSPQQAGYPRVLRIAESGFGATRERIVTVRFRKGVLGGNQPARGSFPTGSGLTITPDSRHFLFGTLREGAGYQLTGVFEVPVAGGIARMILGRGNGVQGYPPFGPALDGATQFELSPNGKYLATDPGKRFWISGQVAHPRTIPVPTGLSCALTQWSWLPDSSGLAYVTACTTPSSPILYRVTLAAVSVHGGKPRVLYEIRSRNQSAIDLAPVYRCVACGG
ncbi:MAG: hypothetical protein M3Z66_16315 [Chloroflexota bacterium]|nr:hypothetical protein [Chloroflexota bacterium]